MEVNKHGQDFELAIFEKTPAQIRSVEVAVVFDLKMGLTRTVVSPIETWTPEPRIVGKVWESWLGDVGMMVH